MKIEEDKIASKLTGQTLALHRAEKALRKIDKIVNARLDLPRDHLALALQIIMATIGDITSNALGHIESQEESK